MDTRLLEHFSALMRHGSFKAAADAQGVSQSTMTKSIAKLEAQTGLRLFHRTTRSVEATDSARELLLSAERAMQACSVFGDEARMIAAGELGTLRVGAIAIASELLVAETLAHLARVNPTMKVEVVLGSENVYRDLMTGVCDAVIGDELSVGASREAAAFRVAPIRKESIVLVSRKDHPCAGDYEQLIRQPLAIPSRYYDENRLLGQFRARGGPEQPRYRLNNLSTCLALSQSSDVVTLAPQRVVEQLYPKLQVCSEDLGIEISLAMVSVAAHPMSPAMTALHRALLA